MTPFNGRLASRAAPPLAVSKGGIPNSLHGRLKTIHARAARICPIAASPPSPTGTTLLRNRNNLYHLHFTYTNVHTFMCIRVFLQEHFGQTAIVFLQEHLARPSAKTRSKAADKSVRSTASSPSHSTTAHPDHFL